ncbi:YktB family protein [Rummeliibacillus sp. NPDC094406]|uniref:YktB family protein n=1 Tax=Rummeliibacillus sp. NPDC094406 TaxID=3364511 RepID=UPI0038210694
MTVKWTNKDFEVFTTPGLEQRMSALIKNVRPKFEELGITFSTYFSSKIGEEFYPHVAKHARRKVNPPIDSWVAFAPNKRGYKALPHFEIGLFKSHIFILLCAIYEAPTKKEIANNLLNNVNSFDELPETFFITGDHFDPNGIPLVDAMKDGSLEKLLTRLRDVKKGEFMIGLQLPKEKTIKLSAKEFDRIVVETFDELIPIYNIMVNKK